MNYYNTIPISQLQPGVQVLSTDEYPATDILDLTQSPSGTTYKYSVSQLQQYLVTTTIGSNIQSVYVGTTGSNLTASYNNGTAGQGATLTNSGTLAALVIDSTSLVVGNRVLIKDQTAASENGIYVVTAVGSASAPWVLTRAMDYDGTIRNPSQGDFVGIVTGSLNQLTFWFQVAPNPIIIGTSSILWAESMGQQFSFEWIYLTGTAETAAVNTGYIIAASGATTITLPSSANVGDTIRIQGSGVGGWTLQAGTGQFIFMGNTGTSSGGSLSSANRYDTIEAICIYPNSLWSVGFAVSAGLTIL
jgi:hypothetical protein